MTSTTPEETGLRLRIVTVGGRRTSVRMECALWRAFDSIASEMKIDTQTLVNMIAERRDHNTGVTRAIRIFVVDYYYHRCRQLMVMNARTLAKTFIPIPIESGSPLSSPDHDGSA